MLALPDLRVVYRDFDSSFEEVLRGGSSKALHQQNLPKLMRYLKFEYLKTGIARNW